MPFTSTEISQLEALLAVSDGGPELISAFRAQFPGRSVTRCDASDMGAEEPFRRFGQVDLYLLDSHEHCVHLTNDPAAATGVVLARHGRRA